MNSFNQADDAVDGRSPVAAESGVYVEVSVALDPIN